ncbi:hypothetical protein [Serratia liquefaciens]|uniref:hypothetical protein n=1 Tax=Serratia liquefaciens TaxID=614 RepID=UPI000966AFA6|nr:hypothetical protein [Serratia liquefaciens]OKP25478.1 hypothetical protein BSQ35_03125 [Serratia liquefaciens]
MSFSKAIEAGRVRQLTSNMAVVREHTVVVTFTADAMNFFNAIDGDDNSFRASVRIEISLPDDDTKYYANFECAVTWDSNPLLQAEAEYSLYLDSLGSNN